MSVLSWLNYIAYGLYTILMVLSVLGLLLWWFGQDREARINDVHLEGAELSTPHVMDVVLLLFWLFWTYQIFA